MPSFSSKVPSGKTISVRIIDSTSSINKLPVSALMGPPVPGFDLLPETGTWSFLLEHDSGRNLLFDLGIPTDWRDLAPVSVLKIQLSSFPAPCRINVFGLTSRTDCFIASCRPPEEQRLGDLGGKTNSGDTEGAEYRRYGHRSHSVESLA